jgi:integrase
MKFGKLIDLYFEDAAFIRLDSKSQALYKNYLNRLKAIGGKLPLSDKDMPDRVAVSRSPQNLTTIWWNLIDKFKMEDGKPTTNSTRNTLHTYLKVAYRYAITKGYISEPESPTKFAGWEHKRPKFTPFQLSEIEAIRESFKDPSYPEDVKAYMMFVVTMFYFGLRPMDMYKHQRSMFRVKGGTTYLEVWGAKGKDKKENGGKGSFHRLLAMDANDLSLMEYWDSQPRWFGFEGYTFRTSRGKAFGQSAWMAEKVNLGCSLAGITPRTIYEARRGLVTTLVKAGMEFDKIKKRVGHIKKETTEGYAHLTDEESADTYRFPVRVQRA